MGIFEYVLQRFTDKNGGKNLCFNWSFSEKFDFFIIFKNFIRM